ncbi:MAG: lipid-A-disaccharide synthase [Thermodesulfobacteriota bacterium]
MTGSILMISGEASGDLHGANLIKALKAAMPSLVVKGMGGKKMRAAGLEGLDSTPLAVVGIVEAVKKLPPIKKAFGYLKRLLKSERFDCVVLIDYPDFNLRFAALAKKSGVPVVYYISPQVWAWRKGRIGKIARLVDKMLVVLPFEAELYKDTGLDVEYVGHPLVDTVSCDMTKAEARGYLGLAEDSTVIALLPGSRVEEVELLLPPMAEAMGVVGAEPGFKFEVVLPVADSIDDAQLERLLSASPLPVKLLHGRTYETLRASDAAVVASGTATLEAALIKTPMVIVYKVSPVSALIIRTLIDIDLLGLPNIISGGKIVPELIQEEVTPPNIARELLGILKDPERRRTMEESLEAMRDKVDGHDAAGRAAMAVRKVMEGAP